MEAGIEVRVHFRISLIHFYEVPSLLTLAGKGVEQVNLPNLLTTLRILMVPAVVHLLARGSYAPAMWLFLACGVTDALDGYIARHYGLTTQLGAILDPIADKLLIIAPVIVLASDGLLPWWLAFAIVCRDLVIVVGAGCWYRKAGRLDMAPSLPGKINTFVLIALVGLVIGQAAGLLRIASLLPLLFILSLCTTLVSGVHYVVVWGGRARAL